MGMYSSFDYEDIEVIDWKGLKEFFEIWDKEVDKDNYNHSSRMIKKNDDGTENFTFEEWDNLKLISYWYDEELVFLSCIAKYIDGNVSWNFENKDEAGQVEFDGGECFIETGQMIWSKWKSIDNIKLDELDERKRRLLTLSRL